MAWQCECLVCPIRDPQRAVGEIGRGCMLDDVTANGPSGTWVWSRQDLRVARSGRRARARPSANITVRAIELGHAIYSLPAQCQVIPSLN